MVGKRDRLCPLQMSVARHEGADILFRQIEAGGDCVSHEATGVPTCRSHVQFECGCDLVVAAAAGMDGFTDIS